MTTSIALFNAVNKTNYSGVVVEGSTIKLFKTGAHNIPSTNIYEFAEKCVEFCCKRGYRFVSEYLAEKCVRIQVENIYDDTKMKDFFGESRAVVEIDAANFVYENFIKGT